ncbi:uncharacterized protein LOC132735327 [Ruditapes philippinarum]|uniref:uncharacterized protein LOC132735327 n=1 Tax=Ruditapes philippinarum TaxID=129788 RepID=UPI00295A898B|nr:uncharacterized protein LOC132735327 [Ruditapes philippinarum]
MGLKHDLMLSNKQAYAEGTWKNLKIQWEAFLLFCTYFHLVSLPVSTETLQLYAQFLSRSMKSVDSIRNYISGVKTMHLLLGASVEHINNFLLNLSLKGISKQKLYLHKQATPITPEILLSIFKCLDFTQVDNVVFWCLFLFAFFLLARKSNLVPTNLRDLQNPKFLLRKDIVNLGTYLLVKMKWSKTIQAGERILEVPLHSIDHSCLCPVSAYNNMIKVVPGKANDPLFSLGSNKPVTYAIFMRKLKSCIDNIGLNSEDFSTHSFRRGFATYAFRLNLPADLIQLMGDWKSDAYKKYIEYSFQDKLRVSKFISNKLKYD